MKQKRSPAALYCNGSKTPQPVCCGMFLYKQQVRAKTKGLLITVSWLPVYLGIFAWVRMNESCLALFSIALRRVM
jgi:hypothetical protein